MTDRRTDAKPCRDCGYPLEPNARGCPRCAMNVEAETMIEHFVWWRLLPCVVVIFLLGIAAFVWLG